MAEPGFFKHKCDRLSGLPQRQKNEGGKSTDNRANETQSPPVPLLPFHFEFQTGKIVICARPALPSSRFRPNEMIILE